MPTMTAAETLTFYAALTQTSSRRTVSGRATSPPASAPRQAAAATAAGSPAAAAATPAGAGCGAGSAIVHTTVHVWTSDSSSNNDTSSSSSSNNDSIPHTVGPKGGVAGQLQARVEEVLGLVGLTQQASTLVSGCTAGNNRADLYRGHTLSVAWVDVVMMWSNHQAKWQPPKLSLFRCPCTWRLCHAPGSCLFCSVQQCNMHLAYIAMFQGRHTQHEHTPVWALKQDGTALQPAISAPVPVPHNK